MAEVVPFKGVLYNVPRISQVSGEDLLAPPYDIITPEYREELYQKSPYNVVRIDFGKEFSNDTSQNDKYTRAKAYLDEWLKEQVLMSSKEPCFYAYEISYTINQETKTLRGFIGLVRLEELGTGNIHPHECTHSKPKKDRLDLMKMCGANISPIFSLYGSKEKKTASILSRASKTRPYIEAKDSSGAIHRLWEIANPEEITAIKNELLDKAIFIADGHHRYETALEYQKEMRRKESGRDQSKPYDYVMMFLANMSNEGLTILPTHRLVKKLGDDSLERLSAYFAIEKVSGNSDITGALSSQRHILGFYKGDDDIWYILRYKGMHNSEIPPVLANLDVSILHELVLGRLLHISDIVYEMDIHKCIKLVKERRFDAAFFLNPTLVEEVESVALASLRMPPKSTYFYPKLLTGLVLNIFKYTF